MALNLSLANGGATGQGFTVDLFSDAGANGPGAELLQIASVSDASLTNAFSLKTYTPAIAYLLNAGYRRLTGKQCIKA